MATKIQRGIAAKVFALQKSGAQVPPHVLASARRVLEAKERPEDVQVVRNYLGISKGGATKLKGSLGVISNIQGAAFSLTRDIELLQSAKERGQDVGLPAARLMLNLNHQVQAAIKSKWAKNVAEQAVKVMGKDPVLAARFLYGLGRFARYAGVFGSVAIATYEAMGAFSKAYLSMARMSAAQGKAMDVGRASGLDPRSLREIRRTAGSEMQTTHRLDPFAALARAGLNPWGLGSLAEEELKIQQGIIDRRKTMAQNPLALGVDEGLVYSNEAKRLGKSISDLTPRERAEAIDKQFKSEFRLMEEAKASKYMESEMARRYPWYEIERYYDNVGKAQERLRIEREYKERQVRTAIRKRQDVEILEQQFEERKSPGQRIAEQDRKEFARANWAVWRTRHRAWQND